MRVEGGEAGRIRRRHFPERIESPPMAERPLRSSPKRNASSPTRGVPREVAPFKYIPNHNMMSDLDGLKYERPERFKSFLNRDLPLNPGSSSRRKFGTRTVSFDR